MRHDFEALREVLLPLAKSGEEFEAPRVIKQARPPSYLVYLLIGVLQKAGRLASPTRGTYRFPQPLDASDFDAVWDRLPREE